MVKVLQETINTQSLAIKALDEKFQGQLKTTKTIQTTVEENAKDVKDLSSKFKENESNWKRAGNTFEIVVRRELRTTRGIDYARSFCIKDLHGLARIALPKDVKVEDGSFKVCTESEISKLHTARVNALALKAHTKIPVIEGWLAKFKDSVSGYLSLASNKKNDAQKFLTTKWKSLEQQLKSYANCLTLQSQLEFLEVNLLGLWAFSTEAFQQEEPDYVFELQTDVRGTVSVRGDRLDIVVGEIKGGKSCLNEATGQILKRLSVIGAASSELLFKTSLKICLHGEIFNCHNWICTPAVVEEEREKLKLIKRDDLSVCCINV